MDTKKCPEIHKVLRKLTVETDEWTDAQRIGAYKYTTYVCRGKQKGWQGDRQDRSMSSPQDES